eukprot:353150_1
MNNNLMRAMACSNLTMASVYFVFSMMFSFMDGLYELHFQNTPTNPLPYFLKKSDNLYGNALRKEGKQFGDKVKRVIPWKQIQDAMLHVFNLMIITTAANVIFILIMQSFISSSPSLEKYFTIFTINTGSQHSLIRSMLFFWMNRIKSLILNQDLELIFKEILWIIVATLFADVFFYIGHIIMHKFKPLYVYGHKYHHQYIINFAVFGAAAHIFDQLFINLPTIVGPTVVAAVLIGPVDMMIPFTVYVIFMFGTTVQHCNFQIFDKFLNRMVIKHDYHHKYSDCSYGIGIFMDTLFKTTFEDVHGKKSQTTDT